MIVTNNTFQKEMETYFLRFKKIGDQVQELKNIKGVEFKKKFKRLEKDYFQCKAACYKIFEKFYELKSYDNCFFIQAVGYEAFMLDLRMHLPRETKNVAKKNSLSKKVSHFRDSIFNREVFEAIGRYSNRMIKRLQPYMEQERPVQSLGGNLFDDYALCEKSLKYLKTEEKQLTKVSEQLNPGNINQFWSKIHLQSKKLLAMCQIIFESTLGKEIQGDEERGRLYEQLGILRGYQTDI